MTFNCKPSQLPKSASSIIAIRKTDFVEAMDCLVLLKYQVSTTYSSLIKISINFDDK